MGNDQRKRFSLDDDDTQSVHDIKNAKDQRGSRQSPDDSSAGGGDGDDYAAPERFENDKVRLVDFLQYPREKRKITDFLEETYKAYEQEAVDRVVNRIVHEHDTELSGST